MASKTSRLNDFQADEIAVISADQHEKDITGIHLRLQKLEDRLGNNESLAAAVGTAITSQSPLQELVCKTFAKLLKSDADMINAVTEHVHKLDRSYLVLLVKRFGLLLYTLIAVALTAVVTVAIEKILK